MIKTFNIPEELYKQLVDIQHYLKIKHKKDFSLSSIVTYLISYAIRELDKDEIYIK